MTKNETVKFIIKTLQENTTKFVGETNNEETVRAIKEQLLSTLKTLNNMLKIDKPLPNVAVIIRGGKAEVFFLDPETGEKMDLVDWYSNTCY